MNPIQDLAASAVEAAAQDLLDAHAALTEAIRDADKAKVGRNEIARRAYPAMSRATVLGLLGSMSLSEKTHDAVIEIGLKLNQEIVISRGAGESVLVNLVGVRDAEYSNSSATHVVDALTQAGLKLVGRKGARLPDPVEYLASGRVAEARLI